MKNSHRLPIDQRKKLQALIESDRSLEITRKRLGVSLHTMERAAGGLTIQRGTVALLEKALALLCLALTLSFPAGGCTFDDSQLHALPDGGLFRSQMPAGGNPGGDARGDAGGAGGQAVTSTSIAPGTCVPGASVACACANGAQGAQICTSAGTFAACMCEAIPPDAGRAGGSDASTSTGPAIPSGTSVTFADGQAVGAMTGPGWVALGASDVLTSPICGTAAITSTTRCPVTSWNSTSALCITGTIPALGTPPDYVSNWGLAVGANASAAAGEGLGQSFTSVTIMVTGSPSSGLMAMVHRKSDPVGTNFCATMISGKPMPFTSFSTTCYSPTSPGMAITAADVPSIDQIFVQVSSTTSTIHVANLCITGIMFVR